jgi:hypothetical protein
MASLAGQSSGLSLGIPYLSPDLAVNHESACH